MPLEFSQPKSDSPTAQSASTANVLAVDDDPGVLMLLEETLAEAGFNIASASSGVEALEVCADFQPDLVLLDINMPEMDGIDACRHLRARCGDDFPIIMVTSVDDAMSIQSAFEAGASDFILKPINWPLFQRRMEQTLVEWRHARDRSSSNKRVEVLQRVAPEQVMLVSRNGVIIEDLKERDQNRAPGNSVVLPTLDELYGPQVAERFKQCISAVLKTQKTKTLQFSIEQWGMQRERQADFQVDGRERVIVVVQCLDEPKDSPPDEIYRLAFFDTHSGLPNEHLFRRVGRDRCADAMLNERNMAVFSLRLDAGGAQSAAPEAFERILDDCLSRFENVVPIGARDRARAFALGGEQEYFVLLDDLRSNQDVDSLLSEVRDALAASKQSLEVATGVAILPTDGADIDVLIGAARGARKEAELGSQQTCFHASETSVPVVNTIDYALELRQALKEGQLDLHFQPRIALSSGRVTSVEALLRWNHPMRGFVRLSEFLQLAKSTGVIFDIGSWVLQAACEYASQWQEEDGFAPRVSVNLSRQELIRDGLVHQLRDVIEKTGLPPSRLELDITESALLRARDTVRLLSRIKSLGVGLVLDDFGTGFTSLKSLKDYPIDGLKIDASFVRGSSTNSADASICEIIIMMAHKMGLKAIAEGVESPQELAFLEAHDCDEAQGYIISRPVPADEIAEVFERLASHRRN